MNKQISQIKKIDTIEHEKYTFDVYKDIEGNIYHKRNDNGNITAFTPMDRPYFEGYGHSFNEAYNSLQKNIEIGYID